MEVSLSLITIPYMPRGESPGYFPESERTRGTEYEVSLLGTPDLDDPELSKRIATISDGRGYAGRRELLDAFMDAEKAQPGGDASNPRQGFLRDVRIAVMDTLGISGAKVGEPTIKAYSALRSALDIFHGIDAFLVYDDRKRRKIVTLDVTLNPNKLRSGGKADVLVGNLTTQDDPNDEDAYLEHVEDIAGQITKRILADDERPQTSVYKDIAA